MAFQTGVSTSPSNFLSTMITFAGANGWTIIRTNGATSAGLPSPQATSGAQSSIFDPGATLPGSEQAQFNFVPFDSPNSKAEIKMAPSTGDGGSGVQFWQHPGSPIGSYTRADITCMGHAGGSGAGDQDLGFSGPHVSYNLYAGQNPDGSRYIQGFVEGTTNTFFHIFFGTFVKSGAYDGGQYITATYIDGNERYHTPFQFDSSIGNQTVSYVRMDNAFGSGSPGWRDMMGWAFTQGSSTGLVHATYSGGLNSFNGRTPLGVNIMGYYETNTPAINTSDWKPMGHTQDLRLVSMDGREPNSQITLGSDTWDIVPAFRKGTNTTTSAYTKTGTDNNQVSNQQGYAFRRIP